MAEVIFPELTWLCASLFLIISIMIIAMCVCFKENSKPTDYGMAGRLSITKDSPVLLRQPRNGGLSHSQQSGLNSDDGNPKRNSWTVKDRALPEIPEPTSSISSIPLTNNIGEIATINALPSVVDRYKVKGHSKPTAPKPPVSDPSKVFPMNGSILPVSDGVTVTFTVNEKSQSRAKTAVDKNRSTIPVAVECLPGTSSNMVVLKKVEKADENRREMDCNRNFYDTVADCVNVASTSMSSSPVRIKIGNLSAAPEENPAANLSASLAMAGAIPSSDIPYMTPPLLHNSPHHTVNEPSSNHPSGARSEVPYTVISVREPLARVREITLRSQRAAARQNCEDSDDHYAMVPEEEQMYAEIGSGHQSSSSSLTYAHIEPRELPPVPPTVESLKSVAHAHSRQASTVSTSSIGSCLSSCAESSPPVLRNPSALYSTVEKNNKQRKTIHIAEGASIANTNEKRKKVEDMYAKVRKKRVDLTISTAGDSQSNFQGYQEDGSECITPPPSPWACTTPPAPPPIIGRIQAASLSVLLPSNSQHVRRHSADPNLPEIINENRVFTGSTRNSDSKDPNYEQIYNEDSSCYEKIKGDGTDDNEGDNEVWYDHPSEEVAPSDERYLGYETVNDPEEDSLDPGYESVVKATTESDPGYEPVRLVGSFEDSDSNSDYTIVKIDGVIEPGYERVKRLARCESDANDPGYEKIKRVPRADSDATDPGYERVGHNDISEPGYEEVKNKDISELGYDTIQKSDSDADPGYEVVHLNKPASSRYATDGAPSHLNQATSSFESNSTVLFVSGNTEVHLKGFNEHATFL